MIASFKDADTEKLAKGLFVKRFEAFQKVAVRRLAQLSAAARLQDLALPGNRLEALKGNRKGAHSVRINDQWRVCFRWRENAAWEVEIVDYH